MKRIIAVVLLVIVILGAVSYVLFHKVGVGLLVLEGNKESKTIINIKNDRVPVEVKESKSIAVTSIPVLMYHSIATQAGNQLRVPVENFKEQMDYLKNNGYETLTPEEYYSAMTTGKAKYEKPILVTFDDGYDDNYSAAFPILKQNNQKAVIFMIISYIDKAGFLNAAQIKEMSEKGVYFQSHTVNHVELNGISYEEQVKEMKDSKNALDSMLKQNTKFLCYPVGRYNDDTLKALKDTGYTMAFTTKPGLSSKEQGLEQLLRVRINASTTIDEFKKLIEQ
ncbi:polysaccharide deacetylase family protein [Clostridium cellulovorans]|uniref:Polysaccharide deacetylase n=2 Tax=Clostridium cellulovorans TaxID=1493 RepID=D9SRN0_CLOC7|nr:polysaccharide deacetylase family protein [Clostridium cellulovorans]ADL50397.1 polysaccharide deacetylase [Clostridium cellulovorans 743B]BAV13098.1 polysaccharide deacetylase [Clostridium cellulovorans]